MTLELQKALSMSPDREHEPSTSVTRAQGVLSTKLSLHTSLPNKSSNFPWRPLVPNLAICTHSLTNTPPWPQPSLDCTKPPLCYTMVATPFPFPLYPLVWSTHNCPLFTVACLSCLNFLILLISFTFPPFNYDCNVLISSLSAQTLIYNPSWGQLSVSLSEFHIYVGYVLLTTIHRIY